MLPERVASLWIGLTGYLLAVPFIMVFPSYVPVSSLLLGGLLTVGIIVGGVLLARQATHPLVFGGAILATIIAAFDIVKGCPAIACTTPPGYEPWRNLKFFVKWSWVGPALGVSSEPYQCAMMCPYRIDLLPAGVSYIASWYGFKGS